MTHGMRMMYILFNFEKVNYFLKYLPISSSMCYGGVVDCTLYI